ncbi:MAG: hypothetical protein GWN00_32895, partial [Aliifodinibius sp.]|nr:hypothetical protein [Fodinibius sp.]NIW50401.1 hypothetical protein [Gammaproteobacteria bacterium]NIX02168.1 hypothetical protein [Phycisphaerae bacterium]NIY29415.1 hypothetical protein [Fodinibius sp.]
MKKLSLLSILLAGLLIFSSCDKEELGPVANTSDPGAPAVTSPSSGESFTLDRNQAEEELMTIEWEKPDFGFAAAPTYTIQMDSAGKNFANPIEVARVTQQTSYTVTTGELNQLLLAAGLAGGEAHDLELRVMASIPDEDVSKAVSEAVALTITPFQSDFPPIYMIGNAINGWSLDAAAIVPSSDPNVYTTLAEFTNGGAFRFFAEPDWNAENWNYPYFADNGGDIDELFVDAQDGDNNFEFTGTTGWYRITVNMDTYSVQLEEAEEPLMYMTGTGVGAWDTPGSGESVKMTFIQEGVFEATTEFNSGGAFRFFPQADWGPDSYNYPYFSDNNGEIDELLINAEDGDSNFEYTGDTGDYYIKVDINNYTVE